MLLLLAFLCPQSAAELIEQLETRARAARGIEIRTSYARDERDPDQLGDHVWGRGRIVADREGNLRDEGWYILIAPNRQAGYAYRVIHLYTDDALRTWNESWGRWTDRKDPPRYHLSLGWPDDFDPWSSRADRYSPGTLDPLLLYALSPARFFGKEQALEVRAEDDVWVLRSRRKLPSGSSRTKTFRIRRTDLALIACEVETAYGIGGRWRRRSVFRAVRTTPIKGAALPQEVIKLEGGGEGVEARWTYAFERSDVDVKLDGPPEVVFPRHPPRSRREADLRLLLAPEDEDALLTLAWGSFHRYGYPVPDWKEAMQALQRRRPKSVAIAERLGGGDLPTVSRALGLVSQGDAAAVLRLAADRQKQPMSPFDRWLWTNLRVTALLKDGRAGEATRAWLALNDGDPSQAAHLSEFAATAGFLDALDAEALRAAAGNGLARNLRILRAERLSDLAFAEAPSPLLIREILRRAGTSADGVPPEFAKRLEATNDPEGLLAAAVAGADTLDRALERWKELAVFSGRDGRWVKPAQRMLHALAAMNKWDRAFDLLHELARRASAADCMGFLSSYRLRLAAAPVVRHLIEEGEVERLWRLWRIAPIGAWNMKNRNVDLSDAVDEGIEIFEQEPSLKLARILLQLSKAPELATDLRGRYPDDPDVAYAYVRRTKPPVEERAAIYDKLIRALTTGWTANIGVDGLHRGRMQALIELDRFEEVDAAVQDIVNGGRRLDHVSLTEFTIRLEQKDPERARTYRVLQARRAASNRGNLIEQLERDGAVHEAFGLFLQLLHTPPDPMDFGFRPDPERDRRRLESVERRLRKRVDWDAMFRPFIEADAPPIEERWKKAAARAIRRLGADDPEARSKSMAILKLLGRPVLPSLRPLVDASDPELRARAREIVEVIYGTTAPQDR